MRQTSHISLVGLLLTALIVTGCTGGSTPAATDEQKIHALLDKFEQVYLAMDAEKLADLLVYPLNFEGEYIPSRQQAIFMFQFLFAFVQVEKLRLEERSIVLDAEKTLAGVEAMRVQKERGYVQERFPVTIRVHKMEGQWKISGSFF